MRLIGLVVLCIQTSRQLKLVNTFLNGMLHFFAKKSKIKEKVQNIYGRSSLKSLSQLVELKTKKGLLKQQGF